MRRILLGTLAMRSAIWRTVSSSWSAGTARFAQPHSEAVLPSIWLPTVNDISLARLGPTSQLHIGEM